MWRGIRGVKMAGGIDTDVHYAIDVPNGEEVPGISKTFLFYWRRSRGAAG